MSQETEEFREYESVFICPVDLTDGAMDALLARFQKVVTDASGKLGTIEKWGRRKLTYVIRRQKEGFYIYWTFSAPAAAVKVLNDLYQVTDGVLRHIVVRLEKQPPANPPPPPQTPAAAVEST